MDSYNQIFGCRGEHVRAWFSDHPKCFSCSHYDKFHERVPEPPEGTRFVEVKGFCPDQSSHNNPIPDEFKYQTTYLILVDKGIPVVFTIRDLIHLVYRGILDHISSIISDPLI